MRKLVSLICTLVFLTCLPSGASVEANVVLSEARGTVYKRGFIDWAREQWSEPVPARQGDLLHEGMQIGTGDKSWAQVTWPDVTTRAWANSVYAIAPNKRLVYLLGGEMLYQLDKHRKHKNEYCVWTKLVQARMRGTTVLFQSAGPTTRITVLEGCADLFNRLDKSVLRVKPGVVVEVVEKADLSQLNQPNQASANLSQISESSAIVNQETPVQIFETDTTITSLFKVDAGALLAHPLVIGLSSPLPSLALVKKSLGVVANAASTGGALSPIASLPIASLVRGAISSGADIAGSSEVKPPSLASLVEILSVPKTVEYRIGPLVGSVIPLPAGVAGDFPPMGLTAGGGVQTKPMLPANDLLRQTAIPDSASLTSQSATSNNSSAGSATAGGSLSGLSPLLSVPGALLDSTKGLSGTVQSIIH